MLEIDHKKFRPF